MGFCSPLRAWGRKNKFTKRKIQRSLRGVFRGREGTEEKMRAWGERKEVHRKKKEWLVLRGKDDFREVVLWAEHRKRVSTNWGRIQKKKQE